jgi:hypothetical protein
MRAISLPHRLFSALGALLVAGVGACNTGPTLPTPLNTNVVDTVTLSALTGTPIAHPSAFDVVLGQPARSDRTTAFDFAVDLDQAGTTRVYPSGVLGLSKEPAILLSNNAFDAVLSAPLDGYESDSAVAVTAGTVFVVRSRSSSNQCGLTTAVPRYGKFHVLAIDPQTRTVTLELLVDLNCGYRGLEPGLPES